MSDSADLASEGEPLSPFDPAAVSPETAAFNARLAAQLADAPTPLDVPIAEMRRLRAEGKGLFPPQGPAEGSSWIGDDPDGRPGRPALRLSLPDQASPEDWHGTVLHIHGGGWTFNAPDYYDRLNQRLAVSAGCRVVSVRYRLGPEHRWPAQLEDCLAALRWIAADDAGPIVLAGESAGAHLAAAALVAAREGAPDVFARVVGAVLSYGMFDLAGTPSLRRWGERYLILSTPVVDWFVGNLLGEADRRESGVSPLWSDLADMPPALFQVGTEDPLLDDTLFMASRWQAAGAAAETMIAPGGVHAFDQFDLEIAREALAERAAFVGERLGLFAPD